MSSFNLDPLSGIPRRQKCLEDPEPAAIGETAYEVPPGDRLQVGLPGPDPAPDIADARLPIPPGLPAFLNLPAGANRHKCLNQISLELLY